MNIAQQLQAIPSRWYGRVTAIVVAGIILAAVQTIATNTHQIELLRNVAKMAEHAMIRAEQNEQRLNSMNAEVNARLSTIETNIGWLVREAGGTPK